MTSYLPWLSQDPLGAYKQTMSIHSLYIEIQLTLWSDSNLEHHPDFHQQAEEKEEQNDVSEACPEYADNLVVDLRIEFLVWMELWAG